MKRKRIMSVILTAALLTVTGCGAQEAADQSKAETGTSAGASESRAAGSDKGEFSLFVDDSSQTGDYVMMPILEKETGIKVNIENYAYDIAKEKYSLALSSGDYADCIGGWCLSDTDILKYGVGMGTFVPLEDYFKKDCPNIEAILDLEGVRDAMTAPDGHIYSIPYVCEAPKVDFNPYINTKWLKNLGLEMPKTTDELHDVLVAFKEKDANGNGDPNDEIPLSFDPDNKHIGYLCGYFGMPVDIYGFTMQGDKLVFGANTDEYKKGIEWLHSLYAEGLIDPETFTQDKATWKAKGGQNVYGVAMMFSSADIMPYPAGTEPDWSPLPVLSSPDCQNPIWLKSSYGTTVYKNQVVVTDNAKDPAMICKWWDNVFGLENSLQTQKGPLDVTLFKDGDKYKAIDITTLSEADQTKYSWGNLWPQSLPKYVPAGFKFEEENPIYDEKPVVDKEYANQLTESIIPPYWASEDDAETIADLQAPIKDYIDQKAAEWISGQSDIETDWDSYCQQLNNLGLQKYVEIRQKSLSAE